jgi:hypothetical protein
MQINRVDLYSGNWVRHIPLSFRDPYSSRTFQVKAIYGLDATDIVAKFVGNPSSASTSAGGFNVPTLAKREVTVLLGLNPWLDPNSTYSSLRDEVYRLMCGCRTGSVKLLFVNDTGLPSDATTEQIKAMATAVISGFVTKVEATLFEKDPAIQLTVDCTDSPMLEGLAQQYATVSGKTFSVTDPYSTASHGFNFAGRFDDKSTSFTFKNSGGMEWQFRVNYSFNAGDVVRFSSGVRTKTVSVLRAGVTTFLADKLTADSIWPIMLPGTNSYQVVVDKGFSPTSFDYLPTYWGV